MAGSSKDLGEQKLTDSPSHCRKWCWLPKFQGPKAKNVAVAGQAVPTDNVGSFGQLSVHEPIWVVPIKKAAGEAMPPSKPSPARYRPGGWSARPGR